MRLLATLAAAAALTLGVAASSAAQQAPRPRGGEHEPPAALARQARVSEAAARRTALAAVPRGRVKSHELERENGRLVYSYDIEVPGRPGAGEVQADAISGRIVLHHHETPQEERAEAGHEARPAALKP
jgi:uncharacterized membrane protein YkoI